MSHSDVRPTRRQARPARGFRERLREWSRRARRAATLALVAAGAATTSLDAYGQMGQTAMAPGGGVLGNAFARFGELNESGPGWLYYGINAADRGLGYNGSYMTLGGYIPYGQDDLGGLWAADLRSHLSTYGGFFSNVGAVRKQFIGGTLLGVGVYWDYDGDLNQYPVYGTQGAAYGEFGHVYNQIGISGEWLTDYGNLRSNGYIPLGTTAYTVGSPGVPFAENFILCQNGLDSALGGADLEVGAYIPGLADWAGMISVGGYAYGNDRYQWSSGPQAGQAVVPWFGGVYTRLDMTFIQNWDFSLQYNNDSYFDSTGFARLIYRMGGSRRRNVPDQMEQPMMRNEHIVRAHQTPIVATNPDNANEYWRVVHVNNAAAAGGDGTAERPFNTLAAGNTAATNPWDIVFVDRGTGTPVGYDSRFTFQANNQFLVGNGQPFYVNTGTCGLVDIATNASGLRPVLSNPSGASVAIDGAIASGAVVANLEITGSGTGIYATGPLSSGLARSGPATPISYASATGDTVVSNVAITSTGAGQTGVFLDGSGNAIDGGIRFYDTAIKDSTLFGLRVSGPSTGQFSLEYNGSIETSDAENIVLVNGMTGGLVNVAPGTAPAGSTVPNAVTATGGGGIRLLDNSSVTGIAIDNVSLSQTAGNAIQVENDSATTVISAGNGTGINRADAGAAVAIDGGAPVFTYSGPIVNARASNLTSSYIASIENVQALGDIKLLAPPGSPFQDTGDGILVSNVASGAEVLVVGAEIASAGPTGILVTNSSGTLDFRDIAIQGASTAGVAISGAQTGLALNFEGLAIGLTGTNAAGFVASSNTPAGYSITAVGANTISTASATQPAVSIEAEPAVGAPILNMQFTSIVSGTPVYDPGPPVVSVPAMVFGPSTSGSFNVTGTFGVAGGTTPGTAAEIQNAGSATVTIPPAP